MTTFTKFDETPDTNLLLTSVCAQTLEHITMLFHVECYTATVMLVSAPLLHHANEVHDEMYSLYKSYNDKTSPVAQLTYAVYLIARAARCIADGYADDAIEPLTDAQELITRIK